MAEWRIHTSKEPRGRSSLFTVSRMRGDYDPFDPHNYDSGGFGVGGKNGSAGDYDLLGADDYSSPDEEPRMHWTDAFPHDFHGWGPLTPDYGPGRDKHAGEIKREARERRDRFRTRFSYDDHYLTWRAEQPERFDTDRTEQKDPKEWDH